MPKQHTQYDLYFDESGDFTETSSRAGEFNSSATRRHRAASQYVGLLANRGSLNQRTAGEVLQVLERVAGRAINHANKIKNSRTIRRLIETLVPEIEKRGWQPVRLVNTERVGFGDRLSTYLNLAAELVVRVFRQKQLEGQNRAALCVIPAGVKLGESEDGSVDLIDDWEYEPRLREAIGFINVRRGFAYESTNWKIDDVQTGSGQRWPQLILCDLLSNASYADFGRLDPDTRDLLESALGPYGFTLTVRELSERVDFLIQEHSLGEAVIALTEHLVKEGKDSVIRSFVEAKLADVIRLLAQLPARVRDPQLQHVVTWLEHIVDGQRALATGLKLVDLLRQKVEHPLRGLVGDLEWFTYSLAFWGLTACNHSGRLAMGAGHAETIEQFAPQLVRQWQHTSLMTRGLIAQAVHKTDCFEFDAAARSMEKLVRCDEAVADLFAEDLFGTTGRILSDVRAQAMGTWLQTELLAGRCDPPRLEKARELSEQVLSEFTDSADLSRQYQYRCQLEVAAGESQVAREFLARALEAENPTHRTIGRAIQSFSKDFPGAEGFPLLHWLRLGVATVISSDAESDEFLQAVSDIGVLKSAWATGKIERYPAHGIIRRVAVIHALQNHAPSAQDALVVLQQKLAPIRQGQIVLGLVQVSAVAEVAAALWSTDSVAALRLLAPTKRDGVGVLRMVDQLTEQSRTALPRIAQMLDDWSTTFQRVIEGKVPREEVPGKIRALSRAVDY